LRSEAEPRERSGDPPDERQCLCQTQRDRPTEDRAGSLQLMRAPVPCAR